MAIQDELAEHRGYLLRFARLQLCNDAWAEDAVSETLLAAQRAVDAVQRALSALPPPAAAPPKPATPPSLYDRLMQARKVSAADVIARIQEDEGDPGTADSPWPPVGTRRPVRRTRKDED